MYLLVDYMPFEIGLPVSYFLMLQPHEIEYFLYKYSIRKKFIRK